MGYLVYVLDWDAYQKRKAVTKQVGALFGDEIDHTGFVPTEEEWIVFGEMASILSREVDVPWIQEFLSIFAFVCGIRNGEDDPIVTETESRYEGDKFYPRMEIDPQQVLAFVDVWKKINFKRDLKRIPKRYRHQYRAMAESALEYKRIMKRAAEEGKGIVVGLYIT